MSYNYYEFIKSAIPAMAVQQPDQTVFSFPENFRNALSLIEEAVAGESEDRMFYSWLIERAPSNEDKQIISGIRDDEIGHFSLFRQIYYELTGMTVPQTQAEQFTPPSSYCEGLAKALIGEQNAVRKYRKILYAMETRVHINMLIEIITDELRHGILYNYLYSKNGCGSR